eukprot:scaffold5888_cov62-Phaeocystis_antarctica.AAC.4
MCCVRARGWKRGHRRLLPCRRWSAIARRLHTEDVANVAQGGQAQDLCPAVRAPPGAPPGESVRQGCRWRVVNEKASRWRVVSGSYEEVSNRRAARHVPLAGAPHTEGRILRGVPLSIAGS